MNNYEVLFTKKARKELQTHEVSFAEKLLTKIEDLTHSPRPRDCKKIKGISNLYRIRAGEYRIIYKVNDNNKTVIIVGIRHRRDAYNTELQ